MNDSVYMQQALELARKGVGKTSPNPAVGCVIVKNRSIIGQGWHRRCGGPHAEVLALRQAGKKAHGATLYVTLEPCAHYGKTPPCVDQVIAAGVKRVVVAMKDPNPRVKGRSIKKMKRAGIDVDVGILESEVKAFNRAFCKWVVKGLPLVTVKTAQTLDGKIACANGHSQWITSAKTRRWTRALRNGFDAILVGINTVLKDNPQLNPTIQSKPWVKIVLDESLRVPVNAKLFKDFQTIVITTPKASVKKKTFLEKKGVTVLVCPANKDGHVNIKSFLKCAADMGITNLLVEGGAAVIGSFLKHRYVDRMLTVIAPKIVGDQKAVSSINGLSIKDINQAIQCDIQQVRQVGRDWVFEGDIKY